MIRPYLLAVLLLPTATLHPKTEIFNELSHDLVAEYSRRISEVQTLLQANDTELVTLLQACVNPHEEFPVHAYHKQLGGLRTALLSSIDAQQQAAQKSTPLPSCEILNLERLYESTISSLIRRIENLDAYNVETYLKLQKNMTERLNERLEITES